ncbi:hypothetical protein J6TS1_48480 [Siminovitchia terrae]|uniref:Uncharacterized protein n=1 Tax=Siminovitchia terrae TaxID=1914933 RepID=A0ABQ4L3Y6_SIMTE|nr:hypothetical protein [Siminovitchia terrae]GIN98978.1 hypothetical protein J6TS1_48480 [Siminovitchia terrae]
MHFSHKTIHYTDYFFQKLCNEQFGINRGIYNTIDHWFYTKGVRNIMNRRKEILAFLEHIAVDFHHQEQTRIKFGSGKLTERLNEYWSESDRSYEHVY